MARFERRSGPKTSEPATRYGLARILSKRGVCSRSQAERLIRAGRVTIDDRTCLDPEHPLPLAAAGIRIDGEPVDGAASYRYLLLNKPRGLVTSRDDERGRRTVYECIHDACDDWLAPVGRLDRASEGLLLFSNDSRWAAAITGSGARLAKTYHVRIDRVADDALLGRLRAGVTDAGEDLTAASVRLLRSGSRSSWLEIVLHQGRNRQIRRMLASQDVAVLRLVRVAIGPLPLGDLVKGEWRWLTAAETEALAAMPPSTHQQIG